MVDFKFNAEKPRFSKVIVHSVERLMIPITFAKEYYWKSVSSNPITTATLTIPSGSTLKVDLVNNAATATTSNGGRKIWFQGQRWEKFATANSLRHGNFLVFQHEGNSHFSVLIFDITGSELRYPASASADVAKPAKMKKKKTEFHEPKREENAEVKHEDDDVSVEILPPDFDTRPDLLPKPGKQSRSSKLSVKSSFRVELRETHFKYRRLANYSKKQKKQEWVVKACKYEGQGRDDLFLHSGYLKFLRDNCLRVGDVCEFEMIGVVDSFRVLQVSIFRKKAQ
ncbi:B3 domain-containing transcription factor VRN1 [Linum perenne]